jgi:thiamine pyrophosphate-dependent acetolactate synthase large subunit-like protein
MTISGEDTERQIQHVYHQSTTEGMKKYGKRLIVPERVHEYAGYAFRHLKGGVPGPVHLDFPAEVARARFDDPSRLAAYFDKEHYRTDSRPHPAPADIERAVAMIDRAERPILVAGNGVFYRRGWEALRRAAEKHDLVVVESGPSKGHFGDGHRLSANTAWDALMSADLVVFVGQYCMPNPDEYRFNPDVKTIRVHPAAEDLGRNWPLDLGIVADEAAFLEELAESLPKRSRDAWVAEVAAARKAFEEDQAKLYQLGLQYSRKTDRLHPAVIMQALADFFYGGAIDPEQTVSVAGGMTSGLYAARWLRAFRPGQSVPGPYQYGAIGPDIGLAFGMGAAVQRGVGPQAEYAGAPVLCVTSDAGTAYSLFELDTAAKYRVPIIVVVYNNDSWGVWPAAARTPQAMHMYLFQENLRYDKLAEGLGARGAYVHTEDQLRTELGAAYDAASKQRVSSLINCQALKEFSNGREYPPGLPRNVEPGAGSYMH